MTKQICGESNRNDGKRWHDSRSHEKVAGCRLGTVALAPSNTERQTVDSLKAAGTAPPCPPFSSMYLSRTFALLSRSNCSSIAVFRSYTRSFFPLLSFCLSCCPCVHFLSSLFTFVLVVHACFCSHFFFHSIFVYPWSKQAHRKTFDCYDHNSYLLYLVNTQKRYSLSFFLTLRATASEPTSRGPAAEPVRKPVTGTTRHTKAISRLVGRPLYDQSRDVVGYQVVPRSYSYKHLLQRKRLVPRNLNENIIVFQFVLQKKFVSMIKFFLIKNQIIFLINKI